MILHLIKIALRNIRRHKLFSFINVFGLAFSLSFCMLVIVIINDQSSFDRFHPLAEDVYRVNTVAHRKGGGLEPYASSPLPLGAVIREEVPEAASVTSLVAVLNGETSSGLSAIKLSGFLVDSDLFEVFGFQLKSGDPKNIFSLPNSLVLTSKRSVALFGDKDPIGQRVSLKGMGEFIVTGVLNPLPGKTHLDFDMLGSSKFLPLLEKERKVQSEIMGNWTDYYSSYTYVRLRRGATATSLQNLLNSIPGRFYANLKLESRDEGYSFELQPLTAITPGPLLSNNLGRGMPQVALLFLGALTLLGMFAALFNYANLTMARSLSRAKEVGIRKVAGAARIQLILQFLVESVVVAFVALFGAEFLLRVLLIPGFQRLNIVQELEINFTIGLTEYAMFAGFTVLIGVLAGILPAMAISSYRPAVILKGISKVRIFSMVTPRKVLVVLQFALSLILITVLTTGYRQLRYVLRSESGLDTERLISVKLQGNSPQILAHELEKNPDVEGTTAISHNLGTWEDRAVEVRLEENQEPITVRDYSVDERFLETYGPTLIAGTNFNRDLSASNENLVIANEHFIEQFHLGSAKDAVGKTLILEGNRRVQIAGVVHDFRFKPANYSLGPLLLVYQPNDWRVLVVKVRSADGAGTAAFLKSVWQRIDPVHPLEVQSSREILDGVYKEFTDLVGVFGFLTLMAFVISMLGLLGMIVYNGERRVKEIGIRKVMGANLRHLLFLLARTELLMLGIATVIAVPIGLLISGIILDPFAFKIDLGPSEIIPGIAAMFGLSALMVLWQTRDAARTNPVEALRYE
jgi:putative ABC transport system permease protein